MNTDQCFAKLIDSVLSSPRHTEGRNHPTYSALFGCGFVFSETPLVTVRKTAWKKALREMEWFLSGEKKCPDELLDWWDGQLGPCNEYIRGYSHQLRHFSGSPDADAPHYYSNKTSSPRYGYDQIQGIIQSITKYPYSRRHIITTWNPWDMAFIASSNQNRNTPATCHTTLSHYLVQDNQLHCKTYQRSADVLLGVPHNWVQQWALLLWLAKQTGYEAGKLAWEPGDAHIYDDPTHLKVAEEILGADLTRSDDWVAPKLVYHGTAKDAFKAVDFETIGEIPSPITTSRPPRF